MANNYVIDLQEVGNYIMKQGYDFNGDVNTAENLKKIREAALDRLKQFLGYEFTSAAYTDVWYAGNGTQKLWLRHRPITALTSIEVNGSTYDTTDFDISDGRYIYWDDDYFPQGWHKVKLTYTAGWTRVTMPGTIRLAALKLCAYYYNMQGREGLSAESRDDGSNFTYDLEQEETILGSINQYQAVYTDD